MGNVNGKLEDGPALYLRDQSRRMHPVFSFLRVATSLGNPFHPFLSLPPPHLIVCFSTDPFFFSSSVSIASLVITNAQKRPILRITPSSFPCSKIIAKKDPGDDSLVEFVQVLSHTPPPTHAPPQSIIHSTHDTRYLFYVSPLILVWFILGPGPECSTSFPS